MAKRTSQHNHHHYHQKNKHMKTEEYDKSNEIPDKSDFDSDYDEISQRKTKNIDSSKILEEKEGDAGQKKTILDSHCLFYNEKQGKCHLCALKNKRNVVFSSCLKCDTDTKRTQHLCEKCFDPYHQLYLQYDQLPQKEEKKVKIISTKLNEKNDKKQFKIETEFENSDFVSLFLIILYLIFYFILQFTHFIILYDRIPMDHRVLWIIFS